MNIVERIFAELDAETANIPPMDAAQIAYAKRAVEKALALEKPLRTSNKDCTGSELLKLAERLDKLLARATPLPWCWEQCGDKCDDPVIGVAWREDDETCTAIPGFIQDFDAEGNELAYYRESIAYLGDADNPDSGASANAMLIVEVVNALPDLIAALRARSEARQS